MKTDQQLVDNIFEKRREYAEAIEEARSSGLKIVVLNDGKPIGCISLKVFREFKREWIRR